MTLATKLNLLYRELYKILGKVIELVYNQGVDVEEIPDMLTSITTVWDLDNELQQWDRQMPKNYKTLSSSEVGMILDSIDLMAPVLLNRRFQFILTLRYLNLSVLLHRPVLVRFFESTHSPILNPSEANLLSSLGSRSLLTCFWCSMEIIGIVGRVASDSKPALRYLSAWWFTLYYSTCPAVIWTCMALLNCCTAFNAALIVFGVMVVCRDSGQKIPHAPSRSTCKEGVERAVNALGQLDPGNTIIQRCYDYLQNLLTVSNMFGEFHHSSPTRNLHAKSLSQHTTACPRTTPAWPQSRTNTVGWAWRTRGTR